MTIGAFDLEYLSKGLGMLRLSLVIWAVEKLGIQHRLESWLGQCENKCEVSF